MQTTQTIAARSFRNIGSAISKSLAKGNNTLLLFANERDRVEALAKEIDQ